jgi:hypothetical protein
MRYAIYICVAIALLAVAGTIILKMSSSQENANQQEQAAQTPNNQQGRPNPTADRDSQNTRNRWTEYKERIKQYSNQIIARILDFSERRHNAIVAIGTAFIAAFTVLLACSTLFLWLATRSLVSGAEDIAYCIHIVGPKLGIPVNPSMVQELFSSGVALTTPTHSEYRDFSFFEKESAVARMLPVAGA